MRERGDKRFNTKLVRLKGSPTPKAFYNFVRFNTKLVRLKVVPRE